MLRILVVEDDPIIRTTLAEALEDIGYLVETASNGAEALAKVREDGFAAILLDLMMPIMSGWEFLDACGDDLLDWPIEFYNILLRCVAEDIHDDLQ